ncbi:hypothetical protein [Falsigemmobacter faecalis]|uniref:DUF2157 domain-containing protein n=1 Tax=Falsigemmobacter faecalis TaxID=2488730 RepID=A0A3P3DGW0_9RHOB|nr:hypothetical protein [Falsigemmobacter faecalis]RRH73507.1 hypothetical protein EG244_12560 [Falsigemmobacter faecalis]
MAVLADLNGLVADGVITPAQAGVMRARSRTAMVALVIRLLLCGGVLAAAAGFVALLQDPVSVALAGFLFLLAGAVVLGAAGPLWRMFGHAAALIGAVMLTGGGFIEALRSFPQPEAGLLPAAAGLLIAGPAALLYRAGSERMTFLGGFLLLIGLALHLAGLGAILVEQERGGLIPMLFSLYATLILLWTGWFLDLRVLTALAILPFAQVLHTGTEYFHAVYVFYSPEPTLSILQMALAAGLALWIARVRPERDARHAGIFAVMAFIVANLCFLVGSLSGDVVGDTFALWRVYDRGADGFSWSAAEAARRAYEARALHISDEAFAVVWALVLAACAIAAARGLHRGLFNTALTFGAIHAYTQAFESFGDQPEAWIIGGLAAIPLAWGIWRLNQQFG